MARKIPIADEAIARAALEALLEEANMDPSVDIAELIVKTASRVQFQPSTRRLILSFDLGMSPTEED
jgi:hypothetical protein